MFSYLSFEGSRPEWCISSMIYSGDAPFWSEAFSLFLFLFFVSILFFCFCLLLVPLCLVACLWPLPPHAPPPSPLSLPPSLLLHVPDTSLDDYVDQPVCLNKYSYARYSAKTIFNFTFIFLVLHADLCINSIPLLISPLSPPPPLPLPQENREGMYQRDNVYHMAHDMLHTMSGQCVL